MTPASRKLGLKLVLAGLVLTTVVLTALFIHLLWSNAARENVADVASQLNQEIIGSIQHELRGVLDQAVAAQQAVGSVFINGSIKPEDESTRDTIFLGLLHSQPSLSWISLASPDGHFFGAQRASDEEYNLVSIRRDPATGAGARRTFRFRPAGAEMIFEVSDEAPSAYDATAEDWYLRAVREGAGWNSITSFVNVDRAGISTSTPLVINTRFRGVINIVIELEQLSRFLAGLEVGKTGTAVVIDGAGHIVASADPKAIEEQQKGQMPMLDQLGADNPLLALINHVIAAMQVELVSLHDTTRLEVVGPADGETYYVTFEPLQFRGWVVATVIPAHDFLGSIEKNAPYLLLALGVLTLVMAGLAVWLANNLVARPLARIAGQLRHIESFRLDRVMHLPSRLREFDGLSVALLQMSRGLASFQKYMPTELVRTLVSQGIEAKPGGSQETLTVLFADLAGFTSLSETLGEAVVPVLTDYLETASSAVIAHKGTIDKFIGDAVMAFWGAPIENADHARDACAAALALHRKMTSRRPGNGAEEFRSELRVRIGINTGRMLVGNVGSADRLNYTVIGDPVNIASRLEALNKRYGTSILVGEETRRAAGTSIVARHVDWVAVYGRTEGIAIYELLAMADDVDRGGFDWVAPYEAGLAAYRDRRWPEAERNFAAADARRAGGDPPARLFVERCRGFAADPPGPDWSPVAVQMEK